MKKITTQLAEEVRNWLGDSEEVKAVIDATEKAADGDTGTFKMVITTSDLDRYQEVISMDGWELDHYLKNPVVLWGHDHFTLPVGVTQRLYKEDGKLIAEGKFAPHAHAQEIRRLYDAGVIRASSVGFLEKERQGNLITRAELIEWSFVSVPANPYALTLAMEKELSINELVMKGFMFVEKKDADATVEEPEEEAEEEEAPEPVEKQFSVKAIKPIADQLRELASALEALTPGEEPERTEDEPAEVVDEETQKMALFQQGRRLAQSFDTALGELLAEMRQASEARR